MDLIKELLLLFATGLTVMLLVRSFRVPAMISFLFAGALLGPGGFGLVENREDIQLLAELGVILLLFGVGVELTPQEIRHGRRVMFGAGTLQVLGTVALLIPVFLGLNLDLRQACFLALVGALSSTAFVLRLLHDRRELDNPYGRTAVPILIFQDLCVLPFVLAVPLLAGSQTQGEGSLKVVGSLLLFVAAAWLCARYLLPWMISVLSASQRREVFLLGAVVLCLGGAWGAHTVHVSPGIGAFLVGVGLAQSRLGPHAKGELLPFQEVFNAVFFSSVGMLFRPDLLLSKPGAVLGGALGLMVLKCLVAAAAAWLMGLTLRKALATGLVLAQVGEFSLVLLSLGLKEGIISKEWNGLLLTAALVSMACTPLLFMLAARVSRLERPWALRQIRRGRQHPPPAEPDLKEHVVVAGFGLSGRHLSQVFLENGIPFVILEVGAGNVSAAESAGLPVVQGDATHAAALLEAGVEQAKILVLALPDPVATRQACALARSLAPQLIIVARTRYLRDAEALNQAGADHIIPEELEASIEIFLRVLTAYLGNQESIEQRAQTIRRSTYALLQDFPMVKDSDPPRDETENP